MIIGILQLELRFSESHSLKEKRMILKSLKDRMRREFNIAVAELDGQDLWQSSRLGVAAIGNDKRYLNGLLTQVERWVQRHRQAELVSSQLELL